MAFASPMGLLDAASQPAVSAAIQFPASQGLQQQQQQLPQSVGLLSNLIPMDFALGLPALGGNLNPAVSMALSRAPSDSYVDFSTLPPASRALGVSTDLLQQLGQQIMPFDSSAASSVDSPYVMGTSILSPLTATSPNLLRSDLPSSMAHFPTSAFASLNLVNALDLQHSGQVGQLQATTGADISAMLSSSVLPQMPMGGGDAFAAAASVGSSAGGMQPVPNALSAASVDSAAA
ncbi:hypothetical protein FBU31_005458, partial [Coemansia sp. 'formosensis']